MRGDALGVGLRLGGCGDTAILGPGDIEARLNRSLEAGIRLGGKSMAGAAYRLESF